MTRPDNTTVVQMSEKPMTEDPRGPSRPLVSKKDADSTSDDGKDAGAPAIVGILISLVSCGIAIGLLFGVGNDGLLLFGTPLPFAVLLGIGAFVLQWLVFIPSFLASTEHFYDLTGSLTYLSMVWIAFGLSSTAPSYKPDDFYVAPRKIMIAVLITVWALRLGYFLFLRVRTDGKDVRFDKIKLNFGRFLIAWSLQGLWICLTLCSALVTLSLPRPKPLWAVDWVGLGIWVIGFGLEAIADFQKRRFKADPSNKGKYIDTGLWSISRHPNYLGEIILWCGITVIAGTDMENARFVGLITPIFVFCLINFVSGVPLLERSADKRWGNDPAYIEYKRTTPCLFPIIRTPCTDRDSY